MAGVEKWLARAACSFVLLAALPGCIALPVGGYRDITGTWTEETEGPVWTKSAEIAGKAVSTGNDCLAVGMELTVAKNAQRERLTYSVTVEKGKWWAAGIFPWWAESICAPRKGLLPVSPSTTNDVGEDMLFGFLVFPPFSVLELLFGSCECDTHNWEGPNLQWLLHLDGDVQKRIGIRLDPMNMGDICCYHLTHSSLAGFHKFCTYVVHDRVVVGRDSLNPRKITQKSRFTGPYGVEVSIPELNWSAAGTVEPEAETASVSLPFAFPPGEYEAQVRFSFPRERLDAEPDPAIRETLESAAGQSFPVRFRIQD